jgi:dTDP-4-dehydrorhamnose 3,5-epimerase
MAYSGKRNTIRGLHAQVGLAKLVTVVRGTIMDVVVNENGEHQKFILSGEFPQSLYIPKGYYHGYRTLTDDVIMMYQQDGYYDPRLEYGVKWYDKDLNIDWELDGLPILSDKDKGLPTWN